MSCRIGAASCSLSLGHLAMQYPTSEPFRKQGSLKQGSLKRGSLGQILIALGLGLLLMVGCPAPGWAADPNLPPAAVDAEVAPPQAPQTDVADIPSETVSQFVHAYLAVVDLISQREAELQRAETESESLQLQQEIQAEAFRLIEAAGLTRQEYWQLLGLANTDADFRERVLAQVEETNL